MEIVITCISDNDGFPKEVHDHLISELKKRMPIQVTNDLITLQDDEIHVSSNSHVPKELIKQILESFLKSDRLKFKDYGVIELADTFTIGRLLHPSKMEMLTCEICGFFTPYSEELHTHRMTHFGI